MSSAGMPQFSVIIPVHNAAGFFQRVLDSIPEIDDDYEFLIIDDCSTDSTVDIIRRHPRFAKIRLFHTAANSGPATARNLGVAESRGEHLLFFDADVYFLPDTFERVSRHIRAYPEIRCFTGINIKKSGGTGLVSEFLSLWNHYLLSQIPENGAASQWNPRLGYIRKSLFHEAGGFDQRYRKADVEDYSFSKKIEKITPILFTRSLEIQHHFGDFFPTVRNFYKRSRQWMNLVFETRSFDKTGHTRTSTLPNVVIPALMALSIVFAPYQPPGRNLLILAVMILCFNARMFLYFIREAGLMTASVYFLLFLAFHLVAAVGIATWLVGMIGRSALSLVKNSPPEAPL